MCMPVSTWNQRKYVLIKSYLSARKRAPGSNGLDGGAQTSKGALTVQKARMLHPYQLQKLA